MRVCSKPRLLLDFIQVESAFLEYLMNTDSCKEVYEELVKEEKVTSEVLIQFPLTIAFQIE